MESIGYATEKSDEEIDRVVTLMLISAAAGIVIAREATKRGLPVIAAIGAWVVSTLAGTIAGEHLTRPPEQT